MSRKEVIERLQKPWGLKQLLRGEWPNYKREKAMSQAEVRLMSALELVNLCGISGVPPERVEEAVKEMVKSLLQEGREQK